MIDYYISIFQMQLPLGNFFQVTIDAQKLSSWLQDIQRQVRVQSDRTDELSKIVNGLAGSLGARLKRGQQAMQQQLQRMRRGNQEESIYLRMFLKDADKKTLEKIGEFQNSLVMLNNRITATRDALQDDFALRLSFLEKKIMNPPVCEGEVQLKKKYEELSKKVEVIQKNVVDRLQSLQQAKVKGDQQVAELRRAQSHKNIASRSQNNARSRKQIKSHRNAALYQNQDDIDKIVNKITQLQNQIQQQKDQHLLVSNNKVVKICENLTSVARITNDDPPSPPISDLSAIVTAKLNRLEQVMVDRMGECERNIEKLCNRTEIIDQQIAIFGRKLEKEKTRITQILVGFKRIQEKKVDDRAIEQVKMNMKKLAKDTQESIQGKASKETVQKQRKVLLQKVQMLMQALSEKADKSDVKRGFTFFQEKIKEIIIVMAEDKFCNKDSATKKNAFKCLSCDKDLQSLPPQPSLPPRLPRDSTTSSARGSTSNLRKRIRLVNNSISNDDS